MTLQVAFLGYRFMGRAHANALARLPMFFPDAPDVERYVVVGRDEDALEDARNRLGFAHAASEWRGVLDEVDVLYNLGPNHLHVEPCVAALERDVHVLCEKPLAPTLEGAGEMAAAARGSDAVAACAFNYRFVPALQHARGLIANGDLGEIRHVRGRYLQDWLVDPDAPWSWRNDAELAGSGALGDLGAHTVDLARFLVGDAPGAGSVERVSGNLRTFVDERPVADGDDAGEGETAETRPVTVDDAYSAQLAFAEGAMGTVEASRFATGHRNDHTVEIQGSRGSLRFALERLNELEVLCERDRGYETVLVTDPEDPYVDAWWPPGHVLGWEHTFVHENYEFLRAVVEEGDAGFSPDFEDGLAAQRVLDAIQRSDDAGEWVEV